MDEFGERAGRGKYFIGNITIATSTFPLWDNALSDSLCSRQPTVQKMPCFWPFLAIGQQGKQIRFNRAERAWYRGTMIGDAALSPSAC
jgi:hypothetical protein